MIRNTLFSTALSLCLTSAAFSALANVDINSFAARIPSQDDSAIYSVSGFTVDNTVSGSPELTGANQTSFTGSGALGAVVNIEGNSIFLAPQSGGAVNTLLNVDITVNSFLQPGSVISGVSLGANNDLFTTVVAPTLSHTDNTIYHRC